MAEQIHSGGDKYHADDTTSKKQHSGDTGDSDAEIGHLKSERMEGKQAPLPAVLIVLERWGFPILGGIPAALYMLISLLKSRRFTIYCTVLEADGYTAREAKRLGVHLLLPKLKRHYRTSKPTPIWLEAHETYYPYLEKLQNIKFIFGFGLLTSSVAYDIKETIFNTAKFGVINVWCPHTITKETLHYDEKTFKNRCTLLDHENLSADIILSIGPMVFDHFLFRYKDPKLKHYQLLPRACEIYFGLPLPTKDLLLDKIRHFEVLSMFEKTVVDELSHNDILQKAMNLLASSYESVEEDSPKWRILCTEKSSDRLIRSRLDPHSNLNVYVKRLMSTDYIKELRYAHVFVVPHRSVDLFSLTIAAMASGKPVIVPVMSECDIFIRKYFPTYRDRMVIDMRRGPQPLHDRIVDILEHYTVYIKAASEVRSILQEQVVKKIDEMNDALLNEVTVHVQPMLELTVSDRKDDCLSDVGTDLLPTRASRNTNVANQIRDVATLSLQISPLSGSVMDGASMSDVEGTFYREMQHRRPEPLSQFMSEIHDDIDIEKLDKGGDAMDVEYMSDIEDAFYREEQHRLETAKGNQEEESLRVEKLQRERDEYIHKCNELQGLLDSYSKEAVSSHPPCHEKASQTINTEDAGKQEEESLKLKALQGELDDYKYQCNVLQKSPDHLSKQKVSLTRLHPPCEEKASQTIDTKDYSQLKEMNMQKQKAMNKLVKEIEDMHTVTLYYPKDAVKEKKAIWIFAADEERRFHQLPSGFTLEVPAQAVEEDTKIVITCSTINRPILQDYECYQSDVLDIGSGNTIFKQPVHLLRKHLNLEYGLRKQVILRSKDGEKWSELTSTEDDSNIRVKLSHFSRIIALSRPYSNVFEVPKEGGTFTYDRDDRIKLEVPPNAVECQKTVTLEVHECGYDTVDTVYPTGGESLDVSFASVIYINRSQTDRLEFNDEITLNMPMPPEIPGSSTNETDVCLLKDENDKCEWHDITNQSLYNKEGNVLKLKTKFISGYVLGRYIKDMRPNMCEIISEVTKYKKSGRQILQILLLQHKDDACRLRCDLVEKKGLSIDERVKKFDQYSTYTNHTYSRDLVMNSGAIIESTLQETAKCILTTKLNKVSYFPYSDNHWDLVLDRKPGYMGVKISESMLFSKESTPVIPLCELTFSLPKDMATTENNDSGGQTNITPPRSPSALSNYKILFNELEDRMDGIQRRKLRHLLRDDKIPRGNLKDLEDPADIFDYLLHKGEITTGNMKLLKDVFIAMKDQTLVKLVTDYERDREDGQEQDT